MSKTLELSAPEQCLREHVCTPAIQYGALPWRRKRTGVIQVLLVTSRRGGRWKLPKGWPIEGKTPADCAAREAFEEAGVVGKIADEPFAQYPCVKTLRDGRKLDSLVVLYGLEVRGTLVEWPERDQRKRSWYNFDIGALHVSDKGLAKILATAPRNRKLFC